MFCICTKVNPVVHVFQENAKCDLAGQSQNNLDVITNKLDHIRGAAVRQI